MLSHEEIETGSQGIIIMIIIIIIIIIIVIINSLINKNNCEGINYPSEKDDIT